jgi:hypothetical protein
MQATTFPYFIKVPKILNSVIKITVFLHGGILKQIFLDHFSQSFLGQKLELSKMVFLGTDSILRVKPMHESVK